MHTKEDVLLFVQEEDVKFIRLTYFDVFGIQKNVSILPSRLAKAFEKGVAIDSSAVAGFGNGLHSDLFLKPDPSTMTILPWRSLDGNVIFMICDIYYPNGEIFEYDSRFLLKKAIAHARKKGLELEMAAKFEFYLFLAQENGLPSKIPFDQAGYMDVAPLDKGENVRRDICLTLQEMGLAPHKSYHQEGPGQNEIDFHFSPALQAADEASLFKWVVKTSAMANGLYADFSPRPLDQHPGNGMHIQLRLLGSSTEVRKAFLAGIVHRLKEVTLFLNPSRDSYQRFGKWKAPMYADWSAKTRFAALRIPSLNQDTLDLRSADCLTNPYLAFAIMIEAGLEGLENREDPGKDSLEVPDCEKELLPSSIQEASHMAASSEFVARIVPEKLVKAYLK